MNQKVLMLLLFPEFPLSPKIFWIFFNPVKSCAINIIKKKKKVKQTSTVADELSPMNTS